MGLCFLILSLPCIRSEIHNRSRSASPKWGPNDSLLSHIQKEAVAFGSNCLLIVSDGEVPVEELLPIARMTKAAASRESLEEVSCSWILFDLPSAQATITFLDEVEPGPRGAYYVFIIENTHDQATEQAQKILQHKFFSKAVNSVMLAKTISIKTEEIKS